MPDATKLDDLISEALKHFVDDIRLRRWWGKEREAVSLFAFGSLVPQVSLCGPLNKPSQIGIEVRVPQVPATAADRKRKQEVCKDLVIWPREAMNCWDGAGKSVNHPIAIMEWKVRLDEKNNGAPDAGNVEWLKDYSESKGPEFSGYAVTLKLVSSSVLIKAAKVTQGFVKIDWFAY